jgi:hypothetical protein
MMSCVFLGGVRSRSDRGIREHFVEHTGDFKRAFHTAVDFESEPRGVASLDAFSDLCLQKPGGTVQPSQGEFLLCVVAHHRHIDDGRAHVGQHLDTGDRHVLDARIAHLRKDGHADHLSHRLGSLEQSS